MLYGILDQCGVEGKLSVTTAVCCSSNLLAGILIPLSAYFVTNAAGTDKVRWLQWVNQESRKRVAAVYIINKASVKCRTLKEADLASVAAAEKRLADGKIKSIYDERTKYLITLR